MIVKKCATRGAFEAIPERATILDLEKIKSKYEVIADLPILLIIKYKGYEVVCYKNGKIMIKDCDSKDIATEIAAELMEVKK